jgi:hypothetical protein
VSDLLQRPAALAAARRAALEAARSRYDVAALAGRWRDLLFEVCGAPRASGSSAGVRVVSG